jgi:hypothetical protein
MASLLTGGGVYSFGPAALSWSSSVPKRLPPTLANHKSHFGEVFLEPPARTVSILGIGAGRRLGGMLRIGSGLTSPVRWPIEAQLEALQSRPSARHLVLRLPRGLHVCPVRRSGHRRLELRSHSRNPHCSGGTVGRRRRRTPRRPGAWNPVAPACAQSLGDGPIRPHTHPSDLAPPPLPPPASRDALPGGHGLQPT